MVLNSFQSKVITNKNGHGQQQTQLTKIDKFFPSSSKETISLYSDHTDFQRDTSETYPITTAVRGDHPLLRYLSCAVHELNCVVYISFDYTLSGYDKHTLKRDTQEF